MKFLRVFALSSNEVQLHSCLYFEVEIKEYMHNLLYRTIFIFINIFSVLAFVEYFKCKDLSLQ